MSDLNKIHNRYAELDALRGIAALFVVFFHLTMGHPEYRAFFRLGTTGVDLFFIISGFVIFMSLQKITKGREFVVNRVSRLYPTYWAAVTFTFLLMFANAILKHSHDLPDLLVRYLGNLTMFQFYLGIPDLDGPYWTLIIEMIFYIAILILFKINWLKYLNIIGIVFCSAIVLVTHLFYDIPMVKSIIIGIPLLHFLPLFFAGTVFYKIYTKKGKNVKNYLIIVFCLGCQTSLYPYVGRLGIPRTSLSWAEYGLMLSVYFGLFTLFVNNCLKFIVNDVTLFLGKISYALYLIHQYVSLGGIFPLFYEKLNINFWVVTYFIDLPIVIAIAAFITYKIEIPYSKKLKKKLRTISGLE